MNDLQTFSALRRLKLGAMAEALQTQLEQPATYEGLSFLERLELLLEHEHLSREQRKQQRLVRQAQFKLNATLPDLDYQHERNVSRSRIGQLSSMDWIERGQNLLITGPCGSGKTWIACALGHNACLKGYSTRYFRLSRLWLSLTQAKADGSYQRELKALAKTRLLILDDWGLEPLTADLMELMDDRHGVTSTVVLSQLPTAEWYAMIGDNTHADAILDRLVHNAHRLDLKGASMRKRMADLTEGEHLG
ncbi:MAG: IS21-like element helper ATPase IstB [Gammaproteobacteria bacterium]|nr:IS21-like element helper ATPase IstB [Gammaproteobacteria bacterium]